MGQPRACECLGFTAQFGAALGVPCLPNPASHQQKSAPFSQGHTFSVSYRDSYTSWDFFQLEESLGCGETLFPEAFLGSWNRSRTHRSWLCKLTGPRAAQYGLFPSFLLRVCRTNFYQLPMKAPPSGGLMCISLYPKQTPERLGHV